MGRLANEPVDAGNTLSLPPLEPAPLNGGPLRVVATTSIIGDVIAEIGGESIDLTVLIEPGVDPHSYQPGAQVLAVVENAHVIFTNGWDLEEDLVRNLTTVGGTVAVVPISAGIPPLAFGGLEQDQGKENIHAGADPHVWFSIANVEQWVRNTQLVLSELDSGRAETYASRAAVYLTQLDELDQYTRTELGKIPTEKRILVTNHDAFGYFAHEYGFEILGTIIPAASTLAEPSAADLAALIANMEAYQICALFTETTVSDILAQTVAAELDGCEEVKILPLYSGALGPVGSGAETYISMFRENVNTIVEGLR